VGDHVDAIATRARASRCSTTRDRRGGPSSPRTFRPLAEALLAAGDSHAGLVFTTEKRWLRVDPGGLIDALDALVGSIAKQPVDAELWL